MLLCVKVRVFLDIVDTSNLLLMATFYDVRLQGEARVGLSKEKEVDGLLKACVEIPEGLQKVRGLTVAKLQAAIGLVAKHIGADAPRTPNNLKKPDLVEHYNACVRDLAERSRSALHTFVGKETFATCNLGEAWIAVEKRFTAIDIHHLQAFPDLHPERAQEHLQGVPKGEG